MMDTFEQALENEFDKEKKKQKNKKEEYLLENIVDDMAQQEVWKIKFDTSVIIYGIDLFFIFLCIYLIIFFILKKQKNFLCQEYSGNSTCTTQCCQWRCQGFISPFTLIVTIEFIKEKYI